MAQTKQDGITLRQWLPLVGLTCCAFVFNTSEFMPIGLLTDIAASFSLTEAQAGIMISVYAWGVMLLSLPLMVFASRFEFKRMLLGVLAVFSLGQFLSAAAPTYPILVCARLVVACAHAVFWSVASIMASRLVDTRHGALAISMIATGSSIAQIFGLPLGRAIGLAVGWRMTFAVVGTFSAAAVVYQQRCSRYAGGRALYRQTAARAAQEPAPDRALRGHGFYGDRLLRGLQLYRAVPGTGRARRRKRYYHDVDGVRLLRPGGQLAVRSLVRRTSLLVLGYHALRRAGGSAAHGSGCTVARRRSRCLRAMGCCATAFNVAFQAELIKYTPADSSAVAMSIFSGLFNLASARAPRSAAPWFRVRYCLDWLCGRGDCRRGRHPRHHGDVPSHPSRQARRLATSLTAY